MSGVRSHRSLRWAVTVALGLLVAWWWRFGGVGVTANELSFLFHGSWLARWIDAWLAHAPSIPVARALFALFAACGLTLVTRTVVLASDSSRAALTVLGIAFAPQWLCSSNAMGVSSVAGLLVALALSVVSLRGDARRARGLILIAAALCVAGCLRVDASLSTRLVIAGMALLMAVWSRRLAIEPRTSRFLCTAAVIGAIAAATVIGWPAMRPGAVALVALALILPPVLAVIAPTPRAAAIAIAAICLSGAATLVGQWRNDVQALPLQAALRSMSQQRPEASELLIGAGMTRGVVQLMVRGTPWRVVEAPVAPWVGELAIAGRRPAARERSRLEHALGQRVIEKYGVATRGEESVRWTLYRPVSIERSSTLELPDIAIVSIDTLRADHLPLYGYARDTAPQLTAWARAAEVYEQAISTASETVPSFASLLTGRFPAGHGVRGNTGFLLPGNWTLPRVLTQLGYETSAFVSSSVLAADKRGLDTGFSTYDDTLDHVEPQRPGNSSRLSPSLAKAVSTWLDRREAAPKPWFLWIHCIDPHGPYNPLPAYEGRFRSERAQLLDRAVIPDYQWKGTLDFFRYVDAYDEEILQFDSELAPILERLSRPPGSRGRIVIFTADHGEQFGEHGSYFVHGNTLHREEIHVPLIWIDLGKSQPHRESTPVSLVDIVPTLLERLGVTTDLPLDGMTLTQRVARRAPVFSGYRPGEWAVTHDGMSVLRDWRQAPLEQLAYNLADDPREAHPQPAPAAITALLDAFVRLDPIAAESVPGFEQQQWKDQSPEDLELLRSLGYVGPARAEKQ